MSNPVSLDGDAVAESVRRVHEEIFVRLHASSRKRPRRRLRWSALGLAAIVLFGGGLATGAAYLNTRPSTVTVPAGLLRVDCASGVPEDSGSTGAGVPRQQTRYFDIKTGRLVVDPPVKITADVRADPSVVCSDLSIPHVVEAMGQKVRTLIADGPHCGTITVPGYPKAYFLAATMTDQDGQKASAAELDFLSNEGFLIAGPVATTNCADVTLPPPTPSDPKMVSCQAASDNAVVYLDTKSMGAPAVCEQHGYPVWR